MQIKLEKTIIKDLEFDLRPTTMKDVDAVVSMINTSSMDQIGRPIASAQEMLEEWNMSTFDLDASSRVAELPDGQIIGYIEVWDNDPVPVQNWVWARVDPDYEGLGVGTSLMDWAEHRLQRTLTRTPEGARVTFRSGALSSHLPSIQLFEEGGMAFVRRFWDMMIALDGQPPDPAWPSSIHLSNYAEQDNFQVVYRAFDEAFQDHWGYVSQPEAEMIAEWKEWIDGQADFDPNIWFLAMDGDEIAGVCLCQRKRTEYPGAGWVNILGVRSPWRKQGLGLALLHHAFGVFYREGKERVGLGVDSASLTGATRLYEKAGMSAIKKTDVYEKELRPGKDLSNR